MRNAARLKSAFFFLGFLRVYGTVFAYTPRHNSSGRGHKKDKSNTKQRRRATKTNSAELSFSRSFS